MVVSLRLHSFFLCFTPAMQYVTRPFVAGDHVQLVNPEGVEVEVRAGGRSRRRAAASGGGAAAISSAQRSDTAAARPSNQQPNQEKATLPSWLQGEVLNIEPTRTILRDAASGCVVHISNAEVRGTWHGCGCLQPPSRAGRGTALLAHSRRPLMARPFSAAAGV